MIITKDILIEKCACKDGLDFMEENNLYNMDSQDLALKLLELKESNYFIWFTENFKIKDTKSMRDKITDSYSAYRYCQYVKDRKEMRNKITDSDSAYLYCRYTSKKDKRLNELAKQFKKGVL